MLITVGNTGQVLDSLSLEFVVTRQYPDGAADVWVSRKQRWRARIFQCDECGAIRPDFEFSETASDVHTAWIDELIVGKTNIKLKMYCDVCRKEWKSEEYAEIERERQHRLKEKRIAELRDRVRRREKLMRFATVAWRDKEAIKGIYDHARRLTKETGIKHSVDHIYPVQGRLCCGLHVHQNLRVLTTSENSKKSNRMPLDDSPALVGAFRTKKEVVEWYRSVICETRLDASGAR